ncbi:aminotransferase class IV [Crocinitomix algicola]|uniref:aminotransferase class IV n=1 Tax=Crocinitomix algicola TaxID=1740263 RepID=UPI000833533A|nr:aminotransferase class IV [Crocinitomix algicola]
MSQYVNSNGNLLSAEGYVLEAGNRGYLYGDGLFETIRVVKGKTLNLQQHLNRLLDGMEALEMEVPSDFDFAFFEREIHTLLIKNEIDLNARVRLSIDRKTGGHFLPISNKVDYLIEADRIPEYEFRLNQEGLVVDLFDEIKKPINSLSNFKTKNCLIYILGRIRAVKKGLDDHLILNEKNSIIESTSSNLFLVSNGVLYTSSLDSGCLGGTMRMQIINLAIENNIKVYECNLNPQNLLAADEMFLTNAINGVRWIKKFRSKSYINEMASKLVSLLNKKWNL